MSKYPQQDLPFDFDKFTSFAHAKVSDNIKFTILLMKNNGLISIIGSLEVTKKTGLDGITPSRAQHLSIYSFQQDNFQIF